MIKKTYSSTGFVYGKLWGGGEGAYPAVELRDYTSFSKLLKDARLRLSDGSLDSGMGYEKLLGALLTIKTEEKVVIGDKTYTHTDYDGVMIGTLDCSQAGLLEEMIMSNEL